MNVPDSVDSITIGTGTNLVSYDENIPVELDDNTAFHIALNDAEVFTVPFKFGETILNLVFNYNGEKTPTLTPSSITDTIWGENNEGFTHNNEDGDILGTINGPQGPVYIYDRFRKLANLEKCMIDRDCAYLYIEKNEFSGEEEIPQIRNL